MYVIVNLAQCLTTRIYKCV